jgi:hypothetical protein
MAQGMRKHPTVLLTLLLALAGASLAGAQTTLNVSSVTQLHTAVNSANGSGGNVTILVADGTYTLNDTLYINVPNVTIAGASGDRQKVTIQGDAMSASARVGNLVRVAAAGFQLRHVTLQKSKFHLIQIVGEQNADSPRITDCILRDAYEQMVKISVNLANTSISADDGLIENCIFEYTAGIGPQFYIGGIDGHAVKNWTVRNNTFRSIISPSSAIAEFAVHFWNGSANNIVERNIIVNCDRGIGFGLDGRGNNGGIIRNNMIYHAANMGQFADVGIALTESPNTQVYNNTIFLEHSIPWAIEYRFGATTNVRFTNNLTNKPIQSRDGASGTAVSNVTNVAKSVFVSPSVGDLHLLSAVSSIVDRGQLVAGLTNDLDGQSRPQGSAIDIGADEFSGANGVVPMAPTQLTVN